MAILARSALGLHIPQACAPPLEQHDNLVVACVGTIYHVESQTCIDPYWTDMKLIGRRCKWAGRVDKPRSRGYVGTNPNWVM